ncbi:MAG: PAS domain S-box protein [Chloroflexota bacterium]|nr:PAS domain S-box protein [Chloroflexota bacterium]
MPPVNKSRLDNVDRLKSLERLKKLDLTHNPAFDRLTRLAARTLNVPKVIASLINGDKQWLISSVGLPASIASKPYIPAAYSLCQYVVAEQQLLIVTDARLDERFADLPAVAKPELAAVAYLGMPLITAEGHFVGVLCAIDHQSHVWTSTEIDMMHDLSLSVMTEIELSLRLVENEEVKQRLAEERDLLRTLIDSFPDYIFIKDEQARFIVSNHAHTRAAGIENADDLVGKHASEAFPPELAEQYDQDDRMVIETGESLINIERQTLDAHGNLKWVLTSKIPFVNREGEIRGLLGISRDITARKAAEEALRDRERFIEQVLALTPSIVYVYDLLEQRNIYSNLEIGVVLGYSPEEIRQFGSNFFPTLMHPDDLARLPDYVARVLVSKDGELGEFEYRMRHKNGEWRWLYGRDGVFRRDENGNPIQTIGTAVDVTERKNADAALQESEQRIRTLVNQAPVILFEVDADGRFVMFEGRGLATLGFEPRALTGLLAMEALAREPQITSRLNRALQGETIEFIFDNDRAVYQMSLTPMRDAEGALSGVIGVGTDVTEQVRARDAAATTSAQLKLLRQIEAELTATLDIGAVLRVTMHALVNASGATDGYIALMENDVLTISATTGRYEPGTLTYPPRGRIAEAIATRQAIVSSKGSRSDKKGPPRSKAQILLPLAYGDQVIGLVNLESSTRASFKDDDIKLAKSIAMRAAVALENARLYSLSQTQLITLRQLYDKVSALEQIKTDMIRIAAHDLRNPLTAVNGYLDLLTFDLNGKMSLRQHDYFNMIMQSMRTMQKIVLDILSLQRIETLHETANYTPVQLNELVEELFETNRKRADDKGLLYRSVLSSASLYVSGDQPQLREAIDNLISNAIKYTPEGGRVEVRLSCDNSQVIFAVEDTGYGIPEELQGRLFQAFFRAKRPEIRAIEGTGLGLHLVKNIIERHGGNMFFSSRPGKGSTFGFKLALTPAPTKPLANRAP